MRTILAVDGGNSKTDVAILTADGRLLAAVRGPSSSHQAVGLERGMERLAAMVAETVGLAGLTVRPEIGVYCVAGADTGRDVRRLIAALGVRGFAEDDLVRNDAFGALRAGTDRPWGVVVICGAGVNAAGVAPDGRMVRLDALGPISGDWGGGNDVGWAGLAAAVRSRDGRGPQTRLATDVPAHFGLRTPVAVTSAMYTGRVSEGRIGELSPVVFSAAETGDVVARGIVDRLADEIVAMAGAMLRRLHLTRRDPEVVLGGGVFRTREPRFWARIAEGVTAIAPSARLTPLTVPPVAGAALIGLDQLLAEVDDEARAHVGQTVRAALGGWDRSVR